MRIPLSKPDIGELEVAAVTRCLRSGQLSIGPLLVRFEEKFARFAGTRFAVAVSSGTAGLHLCAKALGIGHEDDVITTSFSFAASTNCLLYENARPVFADVDPISLNLAPDEVRKVVSRWYIRDSVTQRWVNRRSRRTLKAILPVHIFGLPCEMGPLLEAAREFDLCVIEDACEALGAAYHGRPVGTFGNAAVFAFYPNKQLTTAEGGMIVTDDPQLADLCRSLRNQGRAENSGWLLHERLGFNYRLSELHCALGLAQLERIEELLAARERVARLYVEALAGQPGIELLVQPPHATRSWFAFVIRLSGSSPGHLRDELMTTLREQGIDSRPYFPAIHQQPYFRALHLDPPGPLPQTESAAARCLALPFFSSMTSAQVREVCIAIRHFFARKNIQEQVSINLRNAAETWVAQ